ncbi:hypothetical protein [Haploplasma axanthum]|uniref:Uncharacterized protein n=1 Tax=Haploplasma axanthum TaxID=29552 RepID=A0A449BBS2_HAPAX|nr:hypothetical protein [Haploplasma axanthum]VEU79904.1 Uncharacterised protein [Haploplasma axanthum]
MELRNLKTMGIAWFISRKYGEAIDIKHQNWENASELDTRISAYNRSRKDHYMYLRKALEAKDSIGRNTIGLSVDEIKKMAAEICVLLLKESM